MTHGRITFFVMLFIGIALGAIAWEVLPIAYLLFMFAMEPPRCDDMPVKDRSAINARGDVVEEYLRDCTAIGTFLDYSIVLQLHGDEKPTTLVEHSDLQDDYPKFLWLEDDTLMIDLGKVSWIRSQAHKIGRVKISYVYSMGE